MSAESDAQPETLAADGDVAHAPTPWIVTSSCALLPRAAPATAALRRARHHSADAASRLTQNLAATGFTPAPRTLAARASSRQIFPRAVFLRSDAGARHSGTGASGQGPSAGATPVPLLQFKDRYAAPLAIYARTGLCTRQLTNPCNTAA